MRSDRSLPVPTLEARTLRALKRSAGVWLRGETNLGSEVARFYWGTWPEDADRSEIKAAQKGMAMLRAWLKRHELRSQVCDGLVGTDEVFQVSYYGLRLSFPVDMRWSRGGKTDAVIFSLEEIQNPETNLLVNAIWHHKALNGYDGDILLYNFNNNCYNKVESVNPGLLPSAMNWASELIERGVQYPTFSGCAGCKVSDRCLNDEIILQST